MAAQPTGMGVLRPVPEPPPPSLRIGEAAAAPFGTVAVMNQYCKGAVLVPSDGVRRGWLEFHWPGPVLSHPGA